MSGGQSAPDFFICEYEGPDQQKIMYSTAQLPDGNHAAGSFELAQRFKANERF
jgi:hypothetical protein